MKLKRKAITTTLLLLALVAPLTGIHALQSSAVVPIGVATNTKISGETVSVERKTTKGNEEERPVGSTTSHNFSLIETLAKRRLSTADTEDAHGDGHNEMSVHVTYEDIYNILIFLIVAYIAGMITESLGMPALVGEICTGFLLGPPLADFVPFAEALVLVGEIGLIMLILEAGIEIDVTQLKQTGTRALAIAVTGSTLPVLMGIGLATVDGHGFKAALAVGASFAPTSLGVAASALGAGNMLSTPVGQLIVASCVIDDVIGLVLLSMFKVLVKDDPQIYEYFLPLISSFGFLIVLGLSAVTWMPRLIETKILPLVKKPYRETVMFGIMTVLMMIYLPLLNYTQASYLTGAFLAGATFSQIHSAHHAFIKNTHSVMTWLLRIFFSASIGFQVPIKLFAEPIVLAWGFIFYLCIAVKFPLGFYVPHFEEKQSKDAIYDPYRRDVIVTGLSMSCRGEFSFIIASFALSEGLFEPNLYASVVFAVLFSAITSPFMLLNSIKYYNNQQKLQLEATNPIKHRSADGKMPLHLHLKVKSKNSWGLQEKLTKAIRELDLIIVDQRTSHKRGLDPIITTEIYVQDKITSIAIPTIELQRSSQRALNTDNEVVKGLARNLSKASLASGMESIDEDSELISEQLTEEQKTQVRLLAQVLSEESIVDQRILSIEKILREEVGNLVMSIEIDSWKDWNAALDNIVMQSGEGAQLTTEFFMDLFDKVDADGSGAIDEDELYEALQEAGVNITKDGLQTMIAMVDENNDGEVDRDEWKSAIDFYIEQKDPTVASGFRSDRAHRVLQAQNANRNELDGVVNVNTSSESDGITTKEDGEDQVGLSI